MTGIDPYDLTPPDRSLVPDYHPLSSPLPGQRETHAQQMARTDRQIEQERQARELSEKLRAALADWRNTEGAFMLWGNAVAVAVLRLHRPESDAHEVICYECLHVDEYGDYDQTWPCNTYTEIKGFM